MLCKVIPWINLWSRTIINYRGRSYVPLYALLCMIIIMEGDVLQVIISSIVVIQEHVCSKDRLFDHFWALLILETVYMCNTKSTSFFMYCKPTGLCLFSASVNHTASDYFIVLFIGPINCPTTWPNIPSKFHVSINRGGFLKIFNPRVLYTCKLSNVSFNNHLLFTASIYQLLNRW